MEWRDVSFWIGENQVLKNNTGILEPGHLCGIFGPSGCGKTTLLNVLSGRQRGKGRIRSGSSWSTVRLSGQLFARGLPVPFNYFAGKTAFVYQDNALPPMETPRECLLFSAYLRLPRSVPRKEREALVERLIEKLNLEDCADRVVGDLLMKGISGGEAKRTAVGVELISNPRMIVLDEPLSGLDSFNAFSLITALRSLAETHVPVLMTVHQPSSESFMEMHDALVMHKGEVCYFGRAERLASHFHQLGFPCPSHCNPADHAVFVIQKESEDVSRRIKETWTNSAMGQEMMHRIGQAGKHDVSAPAIYRKQAHASSSDDESTGGSEDDSQPAPSCCRKKNEQKLLRGPGRYSSPRFEGLETPSRTDIYGLHDMPCHRIALRLGFLQRRHQRGKRSLRSELRCASSI